MMFIMTSDQPLVYCILLDHMISVLGGAVQIVHTILANEALLYLGGGAGDLFMG